MANTATQGLRLKRATKAILTSQLVSGKLGVLLAGEPAFETDTGQLKVGDGVSDYASLPYVGGGGGGEDPRFVISDPENGQILMYDATSKKWINKVLTDDNSIVYMDDDGLTIKGYDTATQGQMLVKDATAGLTWVDPVSDASLQAAVSQASTHAATAGNYATQAGNSAVSADTSAKQASSINQQTMSWVNGKFWWGTLEEYNALESITSGTFYFITP